MEHFDLFGEYEVCLQGYYSEHFLKENYLLVLYAVFVLVVLTAANQEPRVDLMRMCL